MATKDNKQIPHLKMNIELVFEHNQKSKCYQQQEKIIKYQFGFFY